MADLRLVLGSQLQRFMFASPLASSQNDRIARRTLARLTELGLLHRLDRRVGGLRAGSSSFVYALTPRGARVVGRTTGRAREPSLTFLSHQLAVDEVFVRLHELRGAGAITELRLQTEPDCWRPLRDGSGSALKPDLFAVVGRTDDELLAFIEVDLGTEHAAALSRKLALYRDHFASGDEQEREGIFPEVLWQVPDEPRADQLRAVIERFAGPRLHRVLVTDQLYHYLYQ